jgi:hypothetical protein
MAKALGQGKGPRRTKAAGRPRAAAKKKTGQWRDRDTSYSDADVINALNHIVRRKILRLLHRPEGPRSPVRCAEQLGHRLSNVAYHFKVLFNHMIIVPDGTAPARGATEHFYASNVVDNPVIIEILEATREADELL